MLKVPGAVDLMGGDLAHRAQKMLIGRFSGKNLLLKESLTHKLDQLRAELAGPNPTPLERLLVERVVTCWLQIHHLELLYADRDNITLTLGIYFQRCITAAQKRYLAAIKTLAVVRKLAVPVLQVNIARKQVNVAGPAPVGAAVRVGEANKPAPCLAQTGHSTTTIGPPGASPDAKC
jgi:hypothetical protein